MGLKYSITKANEVTRRMLGIAKQTCMLCGEEGFEKQMRFKRLYLFMLMIKSHCAAPDYEQEEYAYDMDHAVRIFLDKSSLCEWNEKDLRQRIMPWGDWTDGYVCTRCAAEDIN